MDKKVFREEFYKYYQREADFFYRAPARINLIGEHSDYNGGYVLPCAIDKYIYALVGLRNDRIINLRSLNFKFYKEQSLDDLDYKKENDWQNYLLGCFDLLIKKGYKIDRGLDILVESDIPVASGLSSSAAILDLMLFILNDIFKLGLSLEEIALYAKDVENNYCGLRCGIMDQAVIALGKKDKALLLDCANFKYTYENIHIKNCCFVVLNTNKPRGLLSSKFNERVDECHQALKELKKYYPINTICDLKEDDLERVKDKIKDNLYHRVKHVLSEQRRVLEFVRALEDGDIDKLGSILNESHQSLRDDFEVSCEQLNVITDAAKEFGALGSRMTGAGFGGCAIALVPIEIIPEFISKVEEKYYSLTGIKGSVFAVNTSDGPVNIRI